MSSQEPSRGYLASLPAETLLNIAQHLAGGEQLFLCMASADISLKLGLDLPKLFENYIYNPRVLSGRGLQILTMKTGSYHYHPEIMLPMRTMEFEDSIQAWRFCHCCPETHFSVKKDLAGCLGPLGDRGAEKTKAFRALTIKQQHAVSCILNLQQLDIIPKGLIADHHTPLICQPNPPKTFESEYPACEYQARRITSFRATGSRKIWLRETAFLITHPETMVRQTTCDKYGRYSPTAWDEVRYFTARERDCNWAPSSDFLAWFLNDETRTARGSKANMELLNCMWTHSQPCQRTSSACLRQVSRIGAVFGCGVCSSDYAIAIRDHPEGKGKILVTAVWDEEEGIYCKSTIRTYHKMPHGIVNRTEFERGSSGTPRSCFGTFYDAPKGRKLKYQPNWKLIMKLWE